MLTKTALALHCALLMTLLACSPAEKSVTLRFKSQPGVKVSYQSTFRGGMKSMEADKIIADRDTEITIMTEELTRRIVDDTVCEILQTNNYRQKTTDNIKKEVKDTSYAGDNVLFSITPRGKVVDLRTADQNDSMDLSYMKNFMDQAWPVFPAEEVKVGQSWTQSTKVLLESDTVTASMTYSITSFVREKGYDCAVMEYSGNLVLPFRPDTTQKEQMRGVNRIAISGVIYYAYTEGAYVLQREKRIVDGDRQRLKDGQWVAVKSHAEYDVESILLKREKTAI